MKRRHYLLVILLSLALLLTACGDKKASNVDQKDAADFNSVIDVLDREVQVPKDVKKIVVTPIPYPSIIYAIDGTSERMVAIHPSAKSAYENSILKDMSPELANVSDEYVAQDFSINIEEIIKLEADLAIIWSSQEDDLIKLEQMNIPTVTLSDGGSSNIDEMSKNIRILGQVLGKSDQAESFIKEIADAEAYFKDKENLIAEEDRPKVLYLRDKALKAAVGNSFNGRMIYLTGGVNVAKDVAGSWVELSMEQILSWNPEVIFLSHFDKFMPEDLYNNSIAGQDWSQVNAVKNKQVYKTPIGIYRWDAPSSETSLFLKWMGQTLQPEIFNDFDMEEEISNFYQKYYSWKLSDKDFDLIFSR